MSREVEFLPVEVMLELAAGIAVSGQAREILRALLEGEQVCVPSQALEYTQFRSSAPPVLWRRLVQAEGSLSRLGIRVTHGVKGREAQGGRRELITLERAKALASVGQKPPPGALVTPLARDYLERGERPRQ